MSNNKDYHFETVAGERHHPIGILNNEIVETIATNNNNINSQGEPTVKTE